MNFFGRKPVDPIDQAKEWKRNLAKESRKLDRDILHLQRAEKKAMKECKTYAKKGEINAAKILAKEIANSRKACDRLRMAKIQMNSVSMGLQQSIAMIKVQGCIQSSVEVMQSMNELLNMSEVRHIMNDMAREMARAGLIEETINDAFESVEPEGLEGEAEAEVDRVMEEITAGILAPAGTAPTVAPPEAIAKQTAEEAVGAAEQEMDEEELARMRNRIQAL